MHRDIFKNHRVGIIDSKVMKKNNLYHSEWRTAGPSSRQDRASRDLLQSSQVIEVTY